MAVQPEAHQGMCSPKRGVGTAKGVLESFSILVTIAVTQIGVSAAVDTRTIFSA